MSYGSSKKDELFFYQRNDVQKGVCCIEEMMIQQKQHGITQ